MGYGIELKSLCYNLFCHTFRMYFIGRIKEGLQKTMICLSEHGHKIEGFLLI